MGRTGLLLPKGSLSSLQNTLRGVCAVETSLGPPGMPTLSDLPTQIVCRTERGACLVYRFQWEAKWPDHVVVIFEQMSSAGIPGFRKFREARQLHKQVVGLLIDKLGATDIFAPYAPTEKPPDGRC